MATYKNIEEYRRKKKARKILRNAAIIVILLSLLVLILFGVKYFRESSLQDKISGGLGTEEPKFPLAIKKEQLTDIRPIGDGFSVLSKSSVLTYTGDGKRQQTISHGYTNPVMKENGKRILTYDRGGTKLRVDTLNGKVGELTMDSSILCAALAPNGNVAVAMSYLSNVPVVVVYDANLKVIYRYLSTEEFSSISFSSDSSRLLLSEVSTQKGILSASLYELDLTREVEAVVTEVSDVLPLQAVYAGNRIVLVGMDNIISLDGSRKETRWESKGEIEHFTVTSDGSVIWVSKDAFSNDSVVTVRSADGTEIGRAEPREEVIAVSSSGGRTLVLGKHSLFVYDGKLKLIQQVELKQNFIRVAQNGGVAYLLSENSVDKEKID